MFKNVIITAIFSALVACAPGKYSLEETNDYFTFFNKDKEYTQGLRLSHSNEDREIAVAQDIYTPVHKKVAEPLPDERPYAGYAYASYRKFDPVTSESRLIYGLEAGLVGPHAYGEPVQCGFHKIVNQKCPAGWGNQLHDEPVLTLSLTGETNRPADFLFTRGVLHNYTTIEVGNLSDAIIAGSSVQYNLASWVRAHVGPEIHLVARDLLLDGNTFRDSQSVDSKWHYETLNGGLEFILWDLSIKWIISVSSPQFDEQGASYNYGSVTISWQN